MTKMAAMLIYVKNLQKISYDHETCHGAVCTQLHKVYINDDPELTLTHFKSMSKVSVLTVAPDIR